MKRLGILAAAAVLSACGGGGGEQAAQPLPLPTQGTPQSTRVSFSIVVPTAAGAQLRHAPQYVSSATQSAAISVTPNGTTATPLVVNCTSICSGTIDAPIGSETFSMKLYDAQNGAGHVLSTGSVTQTIVANTANSVNVTFNGVVAGFSVTAGSSAAGTAATIPVTVNALDAAGKTIVGPGVYVDASGTPITVTLSDSDTSGATSLSTTSITQPTSGITLTYSGLAIAPATITASAGSVNSNGTFAPALAPISPASLTGGVYVNANGASSPISFTASETGWTNAPFNKSLTATMSAACSSIATASPSSGTTFAVTLVASPSNGSCTLTIADGAGQSLVIPIGYHAYAYTGSTATFSQAGVTTMNITALGAGGGNGGPGAGSGVGEFGTFTITAGTTLDVLVGGAGTSASNGAGGGGGGSFVYVPGAPAPLIAAGGGGGSGTSSAGLDASTSTSGVAGNSGGGSGGTSGNGGSCVTNSGGGGGYATGGSTCNGVPGGSSIVSGGSGGSYPAYASGGFGGGGASADTGGGGGGYSGGGAGGIVVFISGGGGGGSYNAGSNTATMAGAPGGSNGSVVITW